MEIRIPPRERVEGVHYAMTRQGVELPVIDVTHPSFALDTGDSAIRRLRENAAAQMAAWGRKPAWVRRLILFLSVRRSVLLRAIRSSSGTFLSGMNTYLIKLPSVHLASSFAKAVDRRVATSSPFVGVQLRLQVIANLLAERLAHDAAQAPAKAPVFLLNIAGGPAMDSLNALILARRQAAELLANRPVEIQVLDLHDEAPAFGREALAALRSARGPLETLDIRFTHEHYDWNRPEALREIFRRQPVDGVSLGSSEGGLFHYGSDEVIRANLEALREYSGPDFSFSGTFSPETPISRGAVLFSQAASRLFAPGAFSRLVHDTGWKIDREIEILSANCVRLVKA